MVNIIHRVGVKAPIATVYAAIATVDGIASWWTNQTSGFSDVGKSIEVRFIGDDGTELGCMEIEVVELSVNERVDWRFRTGPKEWIGTEVTFELKQEGDFTIVLFSHNKWQEAVEFTAHCSMKWATFMLSLKRLLESGKGSPSPNDIKIDNWN